MLLVFIDLAASESASPAPLIRKIPKQMHSLLLKALNLLALLAATAWLARTPDWEPAVTVLGLLAALIGQELHSARLASERDSALFAKFLAEFPSNGRTAAFLVGHDLGTPFAHESITELDNFICRWNNAEHEFENKKLEEHRRKLWSLANEFRSELAVNTFPVHGASGMLTMDIQDWETRQPKIDKRNVLNKMASQLFH